MSALKEYEEKMREAIKQIRALGIGDEIELCGHRGIVLDVWGEWRMSEKSPREPDYIIYCIQCKKFHATMTGQISGSVFIENYDSTYQGYSEMCKRLANLNRTARDLSKVK